MNKIVTLLFFISISNGLFSQTVDFTYQSITSSSESFCTPSVIRFTKITSGAPIGYVWTFGNNMGSNSENPTTTYTIAGTYTVRLIVIYKKLTVEISKNIIINPGVIAQIQYDRNNLCVPGVINFTANAGNNISSYEWDFGDNTAIASTTPSIGHNFGEYATYPISLKATAATGCSGQSFTSIKVERPVINATASPLTGCVPALIDFNSTVDAPPSSIVTNYTWNFDDGSGNISTTTPGTTHTYSATGNYGARLRITTNDGCTNEFVFNDLAFGKPPTNHIAYPKKTVVCGSESPEFVSKATNANKYFWDFGQGDTTSVTDTIIEHKFRTLGTKTITVTPLFNDCPGMPITFSIEVIGVISEFQYSNTCANTKRFTFNNISQGNQSTILWKFGDGSPESSASNVIHSYPDTGTFVTSLSISDNITGCADTFIRNIYTAYPSLVNPDSSICKNRNTVFTLPNNYNNPEALYTWNVVGQQIGPVDLLPLTVNANILGHFNDNYVVINNGPQYCPDTVRLLNNILVRGPQLAFSAPSEICLAKPYTITNSSTPYVPTDLINNWHWNYSITLEEDSVFQPQPHYFPYWGTFDVKLTAIDIKGCMDTLVKQVTVFDIPFLRSIPDVDTICQGQATTLISFHNDSIIWSPANWISCTTCDTVVVNPPVTTTYVVTATNRFNCSVTDSIEVLVYENFTASVTPSEKYICANESVQLEVGPKGKLISWSPPLGLSDSLSFNPVASPQQTTHYQVTLRDSVGCFSSTADVNVYVKSLPVVNAGPDKVLPFNSDFILSPLYSNNVSSYLWTPSALLNCNNCPSPSGIASTLKTYTITVTSDSGCVAKDIVNVLVECKGANLLLPTAFTPNRDNINDYYFPITRGIKRIVKFAIFSREGILVFESRNVMPNERNYGWDGKYRGLPQPASAYVYLLEAICDAGETLTTKGSFVLLR
ncbi:MAG: PKD domain-containing protein [Ferruginibacter sp.]